MYLMPPTFYRTARNASMCYTSSHAPAGSHLVHLLPRTATLEQAGGTNRMTLRGHTGAIHKVVISPNGEDVITVSEDGTAQVCAQGGW